MSDPKHLKKEDTDGYVPTNSAPRVLSSLGGILIVEYSGLAASQEALFKSTREVRSPDAKELEIVHPLLYKYYEKT